MSYWVEEKRNVITIHDGETSEVFAIFDNNKDWIKLTWFERSFTYGGLWEVTNDLQLVREKLRELEQVKNELQDVKDELKHERELHFKDLIIKAFKQLIQDIRTRLEDMKKWKK